MSKDKKRNIDRRKFVLANLPKTQWGRTIYLKNFYPDPSTDSSVYIKDRTIDVTKDVKKLEKQGKIRRVRVSANSFFRKHIRRTRLLDTTLDESK